MFISDSILNPATGVACGKLEEVEVPAIVLALLNVFSPSGRRGSSLKDPGLESCAFLTVASMVCVDFRVMPTENSLMKCH